MVPIGATLFGLLFVTTLAATRRSLALGGREAVVLAAAALLGIGGALGDWTAGAAEWALDVPIGAVLRGILIGVAILAALFAARTLLGIGSSDD